MKNQPSDIDFKIDALIKCFLKEYRVTWEYFVSIVGNTDLKETQGKAIRILDVLLEEGIVSKISNEEIYTLTPLGWEIGENQGWLKYVDEKKRKEKSAENKEMYDAALKKWSFYTYWPGSTIGLIGGILGILSLVITMCSGHR